MSDYVVVPGKFDIFIATVTSSHAILLKLGVNEDELEIPIEVIKSPVYGDENGGRAGDPIEEQYLGEKARVTLELTRWDVAVAAMLRNNGGITPTPGLIPDAAVGALMRRDHSYRVCFKAQNDTVPNTGGANQSVNFPCTLVAKNQVLGGGTKHRKLRLELEFHRAPVGHIGGKDRVLYDADVTSGE